MKVRTRREWDDVSGSYIQRKETFARWKEKMIRNASIMERFLAMSPQNHLPTPDAEEDE